MNSVVCGYDYGRCVLLVGVLCKQLSGSITMLAGYPFLIITGYGLKTDHRRSSFNFLVARIFGTGTQSSMAKKHKQAGDEHTPNQVQNRDIIQRLNFLYQAGAYLNAIPGSQPSTEGTVSTSDLSRTYIKSMRLVGQKTTVKMSVTSSSP